MPPRSSSSNRSEPSIPDQEGDTETLESREKHAIGSFLRALAQRAEADAAFATHLHGALEESGLLVSTRPAGRKSGRRPASKLESLPTAPLDPFQIFREQGIVALRETLEKRDIEELHTIVRRYRLDPARISSRWTRNERVIDLIVDQVTAYARHGQAFSHL